jgi:hypothetical protein
MKRDRRAETSAANGQAGGRGRKAPPEVRDGWFVARTYKLPRALAEHADRHGGAEYVRSLIRRALIEEQIV